MICDLTAQFENGRKDIRMKYLLLTEDFHLEKQKLQPEHCENMIKQNDQFKS